MHFKLLKIEKEWNKNMKFFKISIITIIIAAFLTACNLSQPDTTSTYPNDAQEAEIAAAENNLERENLDLQAVGALLEKADNAEEFEYLLNSENGVNNLDLNGDRYADYISVREFDDGDNNQRGFSLFSMFGPDLIQEIATIIFDRDRYDRPGARILLTGNEQIYGDNYYYETDWQDRSLPIASWVYTDRDDVYRSPYYYDNYPDYYNMYEVVDTPVYVTRVRQYYYEPVFIRTPQPTMVKIKIKSPNNGKYWDKIYSKLAKPTKEQIEFRKNNPNKPAFVPVKKGNPNRLEDRSKGNPNRFEDRSKNNPNRSDNPNKIEKVNPSNPVKVEKPNMKPQKPQGNPNGKGGGGNKGGGKGGGKKG